MSKQEYRIDSCYLSSLHILWLLEPNNQLVAVVSTVE
jgi:hypothetical protein